MSFLKGVSVIICCYNSNLRLPETLTHLAQQVVDRGTSWEVIIIDNCSTDETSKKALELWSKINTGNAGFKVVFESKPGLSHAREKGISEASFEYLIFCDDDNLLSPDYIQNTKNLFDKNLKFGIVGGNNFYANGYANYVTRFYIQDYAVGTQASEELVDVTSTKGFVWGAGMCFRKEVFTELKAKNFKSLLSDRKGKQLSSGGDTEFCYAVRLLNWKIGASNLLSLIHNIPYDRFQLTYLIKLKKGFGSADPYLNLYNTAWLCKNGSTSSYNYKKELKKYLWVLFNQKSTLYFYFTGQKRENAEYIELSYYLSKVKTLLINRSRLDKLFLKLVDDYGIKPS